MTDSRKLGIALVVLIAVGLLGATLGGGMMGPGMMRGFGPPAALPPGTAWIWGLRMALSWLAVLAFWGALLVGIVWGVRLILDRTPPAAGPSGGERPLDILRRRYAAGGIDRPTFERMKGELEA